MADGWIKLHRQILDNPVVCKDAETLSIWIYLLLNATHKEVPKIFSGEKIMLQPGQLITGRKKIANELKVSESKVDRTLKKFETEQQIEQRTCNQNRLISLLSWEKYQGNGQQCEQPSSSKRTANEQQVNTNKNVKKEKNIKNKDICVAVANHLNEKSGKSFKSDSKILQKHVNGRIAEGHTLEDFKKVIDVKCKDWLGTEWSTYLCPDTLFRPNNFEKYLNQGTSKNFSRESDEYRLAKFFEAFIRATDSKFTFDDINLACTEFERLLNTGRTAKEVYVVMKKLFEGNNKYLIKKYKDVNYFCREFHAIGFDLAIDNKAGDR